MPSRETLFGSVCKCLHDVYGKVHSETRQTKSLECYKRHRKGNAVFSVGSGCYVVAVNNESFEMPLGNL